jgi:hypothetical protein
MSYSNYVVYNNLTGEILRYGACPTVAVNDQAYETNEAVINADCEDDLLQFVDSILLTVEDKTAIIYTINTASITADGIDETIITLLPDDLTVTWPDSTTELVTGNSIEFSVTQPGTYEIKLTGVEYLNEIIEITAT